MNLVRPHLEELYHFIRRELAYHRALGDLAPSDATADEILDSTLVRGYERFPQRPQHLEVLPWLTGLALEVLEEEMAAHRVRERRVATEEREPETPMDVTDDIDTEIYEFYQPDEVVRLEDVLPNPESPIPEEAEALLERNLLVQEVLALLPRRWRQALMLIDVHEMKEEQAGDILGYGSDELKRVRQCAESFMREWLAQRLGKDEIEDTTTEELLGTPLREPLPDELEAEILEKFMPLEA
jgi:DNA-directed RNA polymerase specialized sigma24 family protein